MAGGSDLGTSGIPALADPLTLAMLVTDASGVVTAWNEWMERLFGLREDQAVGRSLAGLLAGVLPAEDPAWSEARQVVGLVAAGGTWDGEWEGVRANGSRVRVRASVMSQRSAEGALLGYVVVAAPAGQERLHEQLVHQALHDPLTGLANRVLLDDHLSGALERSGRRGTTVAVLLVDIDRFKLVNDALGHAIGDALLVETAARLHGAIRPGDTAARVGGDEFVLVCEDVGYVEQVVNIARRIVEAMAAPFTLDHLEVRVSASVGIAVASGPGHRPAEVLASADAALYRAKEHGRDRYELDADAAAAEPDRARLQLRLGADLHRVLDRDELTLYYQPVLTTSSRRPVAVEALLRWRHPTRGLLDPGQFLRGAEATGRMVAIGEWVIEQACRQVGRWQRDLGPGRPLGLALNLSAAELASPRLPQIIEASLAAGGLRPEQLCVDVVESVLGTSAEFVLPRLTALRDLGITLALDDCGVVGCGFLHLRRVVAEQIKLHASLIARAPDHRLDRALLGAVTDLAHELGLTVVAKGVETPEQLAAVTEAGCDLAQGHLLGSPGPAEATARALTPSPQG